MYFVIQAMTLYHRHYKWSHSKATKMQKRRGSANACIKSISLHVIIQSGLKWKPGFFAALVLEKMWHFAAPFRQNMLSVKSMVMPHLALVMLGCLLMTLPCHGPCWDAIILSHKTHDKQGLFLPIYFIHIFIFFISYCDWFALYFIPIFSSV